MKHQPVDESLDSGESTNSGAGARDKRARAPGSARHRGCPFPASFATQDELSLAGQPRAAKRGARRLQRDSAASADGSSSCHGAGQEGARDPVGSVRRWPRCGAKTRGGAPCRAAAAGIGGRCGNHGGMTLGTGPDFQVVFLGTGTLAEMLFGDRGFVHQRREPWCVTALPRWVADQLPAEALADPDYCTHLLRSGQVRWRTGKPAHGLHRSWPQKIGFRIALKLLERGRVAFGAFTFSADVARWLRREPEPGADDVRLEPAELLAAMRAAGGPITKRQRADRASPADTTEGAQP
jgi:hypothetical protein